MMAAVTFDCVLLAVVSGRYFACPCLLTEALFLLAMVLGLALGSVVGAAPVEFTKIVLDKTFRSEGVGVGDINHDGKLDIMAGEVWYAAPGLEDERDAARRQVRRQHRLQQDLRELLRRRQPRRVDRFDHHDDDGRAVPVV